MAKLFCFCRSYRYLGLFILREMSHTQNRTAEEGTDEFHVTHLLFFHWLKFSQKFNCHILGFKKIKFIEIKPINCLFTSCKMTCNYWFYLGWRGKICSYKEGAISSFSLKHKIAEVLVWRPVRKQGPQVCCVFFCVDQISFTILIFSVFQFLSKTETFLNLLTADSQMITYHLNWYTSNLPEKTEDHTFTRCITRTSVPNTAAMEVFVRGM